MTAKCRNAFRVVACVLCGPAGLVFLQVGFDGGKCRLMFTGDGESLDTLLRTVGKSTNMRQHRPQLSSVTVTCYGGVASDLPLRVLQILSGNGIIADKYILSPHSVTAPPSIRRCG